MLIVNLRYGAEARARRLGAEKRQRLEAEEEEAINERG